MTDGNDNTRWYLDQLIYLEVLSIYFLCVVFNYEIQQRILTSRCVSQKILLLC
jgi:hypothetical protein